MEIPIYKTYCGKCKKEVEAFVRERIFENNTHHLEARCPSCHKFFKYLPHPVDPAVDPLDNLILYFGKYKGQRVVDIAKKDREYLTWVYESATSLKEGVRDKIDEILARG